MKTFAIKGRCIAAPPPPDWREQLALMLGAKPRRIGTWAELGLYGALRCMEDAGETTLPPDALLILTSRRGTYAATDLVMDQLRNDLPMPLTFLQVMPGQLLALVAAQMHWQGNACFFADAQPQALLRLAAAQAGKGGILLGCVDEMDGGSTQWLRLHGVASVENKFVPISAEALFSSDVSHLQIATTELKGCFAG